MMVPKNNGVINKPSTKCVLVFIGEYSVRVIKREWWEQQGEE